MAEIIPKILNKRKRLKGYKYVLHRLTYDAKYDLTPVGFCYYIRDFFIQENISNSDHNLKSLPELWAHKPSSNYKGDRDYWFSLSPSGIQKRIQILQDCIQELQNKK